MKMNNLLDKLPFRKGKTGEMSGGTFRKKKVGWKKIVAVVLVLAVAGGFGVHTWLGRQQVVVVEYQAQDVETRDIQTTLSYTGTIQPLDQYSVTALVKGDVLQAPVEEGQQVNAGDLLYVIDSSDAQDNIKKSQLSLEQSQMSYEQTLKTAEDLYVKSDIAGVVQKLYVEVGDSVNAGAQIADVYDQSVMEIELPFNSEDAQSFSIGSSAVVTMADSFETLYGTVTDISAVDQVLDGYMLTRNVTIQVSNPGGLTESSYATAMVDGKACNTGANFSYINKRTITAKTSGDVKTINVKEGGAVSNGTVIVTLESDTMANSLRNSAISVEQSELSLKSQQDALEDYSITAPISGTVVTKNIKAGDTLDNTNGANTMCVIYDLSKLTFDMSVDELDVKSLETGMQVEVTCDALEGETYYGTITNISLEGTTAGGVTTYPVTVTIEDTGNLIPGMNIDAAIITASAESTLTVPASAVQRGNIVYVTKNSPSAVNALPTTTQNSETSEQEGITMAQQNVPEGYVAVQVETGISDDNYIQITSGLQEGDQVAVSNVRSSSSSSGEEGMMPGGMGGGMPGGMAGGMTGGGMSGGGGGAMGGGGGPMR